MEVLAAAVRVVCLALLHGLKDPSRADLSLTVLSGRQIFFLFNGAS